MARRPLFTPYAVRLPNPGKHLYPPPLTPISAAHFQELLGVRPQGSTRAQLYLHLPFCQSICTFCPIHKYQLTPTSPIAQYVEALKSELHALSRLPLIQQLRFDNVYFGGGTPSVIPDRYLAELMELVQQAFILDAPQMTFEGHVRSLTREKIRFVRTLGFNRLSTGVQTFDPELRRLLNLTPTEEEIRRCIATAFEEGFADLNIDLMYNLPGQTAAIWETDLLKAVSLDPTGLDIYETVLAHTTRLHRQVERGELPLERDLKRLADNYCLAEAVLGAHGYQQKNLFVWDRPGFENRLVGLQNRLRDNVLHIVGVGLSAYSLINGRSFINETSRRAYVERVQETGHGTKTYHQCSVREEMERFMIMSLEEFHFDRDRFAAAFRCDMDNLFAAQFRSFLGRGLIESEEGGYRLTALGRAWATTMAVEFFGSPALEEILRARLTNSFFGGMSHEDEYDLPLFAVFHPDLLLKDWHNFPLMFAYLRFLQRANQNWCGKFVDLFVRALRHYGVPRWTWYILALLKNCIGNCHPAISRGPSTRAP
jgi:coproporphyrinogen III oxidase-like Fe-S oxidoreductase